MSAETVHLQLTSLLRLNTSNADKLGLENQHRVGRDGTHASAAVSPVRLDSQPPLLARAHVQKSLVPSFDDLAFADVEAQGLAAVIGRIEFGSIGLEGTTVVHVDLVA